MIKSAKKQQRLTSAVKTLFLLLIAVIVALPIYIALVNAFKESDTIMLSPLSFPVPPTLENIGKVLDSPSYNIFQMYMNSAILVVASVTVCVLVSALASYYLARTRSKFAGRLLIFFMLGLMVPYVIVYLPLCTMVNQLGIPFGVPLLIFVFISGNISFSIFMFTNYIKTLPFELEEAAEIDGANKWQTFWMILFPLLKPCTATICIFVGLNVWNDFLTPLVLGQVQTITVGIYTAIGPHSADWGIVFSYVLFATVPIMIVYLLSQKQFISGLTSGAMKG